jgi:hypothetical protein
MQATRFGRNVMARRVLALASAVFLVLALTVRFPISGQQLPPDSSQQAAPTASATPEQLQQLVAPIALYPDALVAQILAASTYPTQVVQADRWVQQHSRLQAEQLAAAVDQQTWDPSVKALTAFPSVLANLDKNLSWTEALGNAYFNQQQDVLDALQVMRQRAEAAGNLQSTPQERIVNEGASIVIASAYANVCAVPIYDPWVVYGAPFAPYPGYLYDGWYGPPFISFGPVIGLGFFSRFSWGWPAWGFNWGRRVVVFNRTPYVSRSRYFFRGGLFNGARGVVPLRPGVPAARINGSFGGRTPGTPNTRLGSGWANRGPVTPRANTAPRSGALINPRPGGSPVYRGAYSAGRSGFGGGARPSFGGAPRGGGSRGGRHR